MPLSTPCRRRAPPSRPDLQPVARPAPRLVTLGRGAQGVDRGPHRKRPAPPFVRFFRVVYFGNCLRCTWSPYRTTSRRKIFSYNMVTPSKDFRLQTGDSELIVSGVALVRHESELSMIALCGESPEFPAADEFPDMDECQPILGKETLKCDPNYSPEDRYLTELPGYSKILTLWYGSILAVAATMLDI